MAGFGAVKQFTSWSFTRYNDYQRCPAFANYKHLVKHPVPTTQNDAMKRGAAVAEATDQWFKRQRRAMPPELKPLEGVYKELRARKSVVSECDWGFTRTWEPCSTTDWNRCFLRVKIDLHENTKDQFTLNIWDNKTGKYSNYKLAEYEEQLNLYAAAGTVMYPLAKDINTRLLFSDLGVQHPMTGPEVYTRAEAQKELKNWERKIKPMMNDTGFKPKPGKHCEWCPYSKNAKFKDSKGNEVAVPGPCKF